MLTRHSGTIMEADFFINILKKKTNYKKYPRFLKISNYTLTAVVDSDRTFSLPLSLTAIELENCMDSGNINFVILFTANAEEESKQKKKRSN